MRPVDSGEDMVIPRSLEHVRMSPDATFLDVVTLCHRVLMRKRWLLYTEFLGVNVHRIALPEHWTEAHAHANSYVSVVLSGWYDEQLDHGRAVVHRRAGSVAFRRASTVHRIAAVSPGGCTTLVVGLGRYDDEALDYLPEWLDPQYRRGGYRTTDKYLAHGP